MIFLSILLFKMASKVYLLQAPLRAKVTDNSVKINWPDGEYDNEDIFVVYGMTNTVAARKKYFNIPMENLVVIAKEEDKLEELLKKERDNYKKDYPLFSGKKMDSSNKDLAKEILISMKLLSKIIFEMLEAGYLDEKNEKKISDWILSFEEPTLKLFANYHQIETSNPSYSIEDEYVINSQFRKMILIMMMKIVANFIVNNNLVEIEKVKDWLDINSWQEMKKSVKLFKF